MIVWDVEGIEREIKFIISQFEDIDDDADRRDRFITLRLTERERDRLERNAVCIGVSQSEYLRMSIYILDLLTFLLMKGGRDEKVSEEDRTTLGK